MRMFAVMNPNPRLCLDGHPFRKVRTAPVPLEEAESLVKLMRPDATLSAIPIAPDSAFRVRSRVITVTTDDEGDLDLLQLAMGAMRGAYVTRVEVLDDRRRTKVDKRRARNRVVRWMLQNASGEHISGHFATASEACKAASSAVRKGDYAVLHVHGEVDGEGSPYYATYCQVQTSRRVKLRATYVETTRKDPAPTGWLFFGEG